MRLHILLAVLVLSLALVVTGCASTAGKPTALDQTSATLDATKAGLHALIDSIGQVIKDVVGVADAAVQVPVKAATTKPATQVAP